MSSYVVDPSTINKIVARLEREHGYGHSEIVLPLADAGLLTDGKELGERMYELNVCATQARYPDDGLADLPGTITDEAGELVPYAYRLEAPPSYVETIKLLDEWLYQCAEGQYPSTRLYRAMRQVAFLLAMVVVRASDEYQKAPCA